MRSLFFILIFICFRLACYSQQYNFKKYQAKDGLANSVVNHIFQDSKGYLWYATQGGISRFDGRNFKNYTKNNGLVGNDVTHICEDNNGDIWIATTAGVSKFTGLGFTTYTEKNGLGSNKVYSIYNDSKGYLWFATFGGGLTMYDGRRFKTYTTKDGLPTNEIFCVTEDKEGNFWIGTNNKGLCKFDGKNFIAYTKADGLSNNSVFCLQQDAQNNLWIGTAGGGLTILKNKKFVTEGVPGIIKNDLIGGIECDRRGNVWIASDVHGLLKYDNENRYHFFGKKEGLSSNAVQSVCEDYEGNMWIGTFGEGINMFRNEALVSFTEKSGLLNNNISSIFQDSRGNYLVGAKDGGLVEYNATGFTSLNTIKEIDKKTILSITGDRKGRIWLGLYEGGVLVLDKTGNSSYAISEKFRKLNGIDLKPVVKIMEDKKGTIWIATFGSGIFSIAGDEVVNYTTANGLSSDDVMAIHTDKKGLLWIGTYLGGVMRYDGNQFKNFTIKDGLPDNTISAICEDHTGRIFFGTSEGGGLSCFDGRRFTTFSAKEGLNSKNINALIVDKKNKIWAGTDKGIYNIAVSGDLKISYLKHYRESDALYETELNSNALFLDKEDRIWMGTTTGLIRYTPSLDYRSGVPQKIILTGVQLFYQQVDWKKYAPETPENSHVPVDLRLSFKDNHLTFNYQALTTDNVGYSFILEGLDAGWSPVTRKTEAVYANVPAGRNYTFKVRGVSSNGVFTENTVLYSFRINAPFWQTWWFYTLCFAAVVISVLGYTRWRTISLERSKEELETQVKERTLEIQEKSIQLEDAFKDIKSSIQYAKRIQYAVLPKVDDIFKALPGTFILYKPRDIVSGDFYWFAQIGTKNPQMIIAAADCTGHGVPGAFMSLIGNTILNEIVNNKGITQPAEILDHLHIAIRQALKQETGETRDGMDIALCKIDLNSCIVEYSGAMRPLWIVKSNKEFVEIKADKQAIGGLESEGRKLFTNHQVQLGRDDSIYISTDGYADQFGGPREKKFMVKNLQKMIVENNHLSNKEQEQVLMDAFTGWKGEVPQLDDVLVIGIRL